MGDKVTSTTSDGSEPFAAAWEHVRRAKDALGSLSKIWNSACSEVFDVHIVTTTSRAGEITVDLDLDETTRKLLNDTGRQVGTLLRQALDTGVVALAQLVSGVLVPPRPDGGPLPIGGDAERLLGRLRGWRP